MTKDDKPRLLTEVEAAKYLTLKQTCLQRWRHVNKGPAYIKMEGAVIRYSTIDLDIFLKESRRTPGRRDY